MLVFFCMSCVFVALMGFVLLNRMAYALCRPLSKRINAHIATVIAHRVFAIFSTYAHFRFIGDYSLCRIKVSSIVVPENITELGNSSLAECPELISVELPSTLTEIKWYAFKGDHKLKTVMCKAANPPAIGNNVFDGTPIASATLRVPAGSKALYQAAEGWEDFGTIVEY